MEEQIQAVLRPLVQTNEGAVRVYAALCNVAWVPIDHPAQTYDAVPFDDQTAAVWSWRSAGGYVADLRGKGEDYMDFYCSGGEGQVAPDVESAMRSIGYRPVAS